MTRKGQKIKVHKSPAIKPRGVAKREHDPLAHTGLLAYLNAYVEWMLVTAYATETARSTRSAIRRFIEWCDERGLDRPQDITLPILERYQRHLFYYRQESGQPLAITSQLGLLVPLKGWFRWLTREHHILYNPAADLILPRKPQQVPRVILSVEEVEAILAQAEPLTPQLIRDRAMLEVLYSTGLRRVELVQLAIYDIDFTRELVIVRAGKGRKDRVVPIGTRALAWVNKYLLEARPLLLVHDMTTFFISDFGESIKPDALAAKVKRYMEFAGINKPGATHLFRHACATHMLDRGADIRFIQALLGHAQLNTTEIYTHVSIEKLKQIHAATHPAQLKERHRLDNLLEIDAESDKTNP